MMAWHRYTHSPLCSTISFLSRQPSCKLRAQCRTGHGTPGHTCTGTYSHCCCCCSHSHNSCCLPLQIIQRTRCQADPPQEPVSSSSHSCSQRTLLPAVLPGTLCLFLLPVFSFSHTHSHHCSGLH